MSSLTPSSLGIAQTETKQAPRQNGHYSVAPQAQVTSERWVENSDLDQYIDKPHVPRATKAVDRYHPNGTEGWDDKGMTVVQQHCAYFDRNGDGVVYPWETYAGFRAIGFNVLWSFGAGIVINGAFSYATIDSWLPSPLFPIVIRNVHKAKHGGDSEVIDTEGRFVPEKFEELFSKWDKNNKGALSFNELLEMTQANSNAMDFFGFFAEKLEWGLTWLLLKDENGLVSREKVRGMYDGSVFAKIESEIKSRNSQGKKVA